MSAVRGIVHDLIERRLWPVALVLAVALAAVPFVLGRGGEDAVPSTGEAIAEAGEAALLPAAQAGTVTGEVATGGEPDTEEPAGPEDDAPAGTGTPEVSEADLLPAAAAGTITGDVVTGDPAPGEGDPEGGGEAGGSAAGRPRRRRGASRPAGPPA
jgi:ribonuclease E